MLQGKLEHQDEAARESAGQRVPDDEHETRS